MAPTDENLYEPVPPDAPIDYDRVADVYDLYVTSGLDLEFYLEETDKVQGKVLELMCGTGRVSIPLLEAGVDLTCVDASGGMLARLEERLRAQKLQARVLQADVRHLSLREEEFDLVLIPFHSFSELVSPRDQELALKATYRCLKEGGALSVRSTTRPSELGQLTGPSGSTVASPQPTAVSSSSRVLRP